MSKKSKTKKLININNQDIEKHVEIPKKELKDVNINKNTWLSDIFHGVFLGCGGVVYTSSASLISSWHHKSYENLVFRLSNLFKKNSFTEYFKNLISLGIFILSALIIFIISYVIYAEMSKAGFAIAASFLFMGLNIFSIPMLFFIKSRRAKLAINKQQFANFDKPKINWAIFAISFLVVFGIGFAARFGWTNGSYPIGMITQNQYQDYIGVISSNNVSSIYSSPNLETSYILQILFGTFLCGFATFIPGLSGSFMLNVVGVNTDINIAVQYGFGGYNSGIENISNDWAWPVIVISLIGILCGLVVSIFTVNYVIKNQLNIFNTIVLGISLSSIIAYFVSFNSYQYIVLSNDKSLLGASIGLFFSSIIPIFGTMLFFQKKHLINLKFLSFIK